MAADLGIRIISSGIKLRKTLSNKNMQKILIKNLTNNIIIAYNNVN